MANEGPQEGSQFCPVHSPGLGMLADDSVGKAGASVGGGCEGS